MIKHLTEKDIGKTLTVNGWVRTCRDQKTFCFIEINDGSTLSNLQAIADNIDPIPTGSSVSLTGELVESPGKQPFELRVKDVEIHGEAPPEYPLQKKRHSFEYLRTIAHLRPRTNTQGAVARVRSKLAFLTHSFFQGQDFLYLQSPIITASDCEGAGEMFSVTHGKEDFFGKPAFLTVSGQLNAEAYACGLSKCYTFGPTFRAENSHTSRHLAEFWMIEPEVAFASLPDICDLAEQYLKYVIKGVLDTCEEDMNFFGNFIEKGLLERLNHVLATPFVRLTYTEIIDILEKSGKKFNYPVKWGIDLQSEHERFIAEEHAKGPVIITDYPRDIKAFYMRNNDDGKTVAALDVIVPGIGEIIGGAQREERLDILELKMPEKNEWYMDLRRYGTVPHGGFGVGFERLVQFVTGIENIRDAIAFPRVPGSVEF
ncbi:MAG: Asparagine--tRNA ligase [Chlamydiia bacterium]|nr:Asparagine--tRNA ligase [Chlamydiia bacterium]MCH9615043.1 Asparagine--tRNA ligase [Chlamydiia bacterium]MCH9629906.1 Asparagine--tRNA ligase [Chlamydiia bacterium]